MKRWLILTLVFLAAFASAFVIAENRAFAERALLLDNEAGRPLDSNQGLFTGLGLTVTSRADVFTDPSKLANLSSFRITFLYHYGYNNNAMPDWARTAFVTYVENGGIIIGTGVDEFFMGSYGGTGYDPNWAAVFHLVPATPTDLMTYTSGWQVRVTAGQENHPIVNNRYSVYSGQFLNNGFTDCDGGMPDTSVGCYNVFDLQNWYQNQNWYTKISVYHKPTNKGTAIWWNGNGNWNYKVIGEWTSGIMTGAFQNMVFWCMGLVGYELQVTSRLTHSSLPLDVKVGNPQPGVGTQPLPRETPVTCMVTSPWYYQGIQTERYTCLGWVGDGVVVPATGTDSSVSIVLTANGWIEWLFTREFMITVTSSQQIGAPATEFVIWQMSNTWATVTTTAFIPTDDPDIGWRLSGYNGTGSVIPDTMSWTYNDIPAVYFYCDAGGTIEWTWTQQYRLQVMNPRQIGVPTPPPGSNFFDQNDNIFASVQETVFQSSTVRYFSAGFSGTGAVPVAGVTNSVSFRLYTPSTITWDWKNEYRLDVVNPSGLGSPVPAPGYYWHRQDAVVNCSITSPVIIDDKTYIAVGYRLNGNDIYFANTNNPSVVITMSGPNDLRWIVQPADVELQIVSMYGAPTPAVGTYSHIFNDSISININSPVLGDPGVRYVCTGFSSVGDNLPERWYGNSQPGGGVDFNYSFNIRSNPTIITWQWSTQYTLVVESTLANVLAIPALGSYWMDAGTYIEASVNSYYPKWVCSGYSVLKGSISSSNRSYVNFTLDEPTSIRWAFTELTSSPLFPVFTNIQSISPSDPRYGRHSTLAVDKSTGFPHVAYYRSYDDGGGSLMYVTYNGVEWVTELVDGRGVEVAKTSFAASPADTGKYSSISVDSNGRPHIAYYDARSKTLRYTYRTVDGNWVIETVDDGGGSAQVGEYCSLVLNKFNEPYITYYNRTNGNLMLATVTETGWEYQSPESLGNIGSSSKIVLDPTTQRPRIVYRDNDRNALKFTYFDGSKWVIIDVDTTGNVGNDVGITLDSKGMAHIVYQAFLGNTNKLMHAVQSGNNFFRYEVESGPGTGYFPTIAMLDGDFPVISYNDQTKHELRYTFYDGEKWNFYTLDSTVESVGWYISMAINGAKLLFTYWSSVGLRYMTLDHKSATSSVPTGSTGGSGGGGGGCFIATSAFGAYNVNAVRSLTSVRDSAIIVSESGCSMIALYYAVSPAVAQRIGCSESAFLRTCINGLVR